VLFLFVDKPNQKQSTKLFAAVITALLALLMIVFFCLTPRWIKLSYEMSRDLLVSGSILSICIGLLACPGIRRPKVYFSWPDAVLLGFIGLNFLSWFWAVHPSLIWSKSFTYLQLCVLFKLIQCIDFERFDLKVFRILLYLILVWNSLFVLSQFINTAIHIDGFYLLYKDLKLVAKNIEGLGNYVSALLLIQLPFYLLLRKHYWLIVPLISLQLVMVILFNSRGTVLAMIAAIAILLFTIKASKENLKTLAVFVLTGLVLLSAAYLLIEDKSNFISKLAIEAPSDETPNNERTLIWKNAVKIGSQHPIVGVGSGNFVKEIGRMGYSSYQKSFNSKRKYHHAHNLFFETFTELGVLGILLLLLIVFMLIYYTVRENAVFKTKMLAVVIAYFVVASFYGVVYPLQYGFTSHVYLAAVAASLIFIKKSGNFNTRNLLIGLFIASIFCTSWSAFRMQAHNSMNEAQRQKSKKRFSNAIKLMEPLKLNGVSEFHRNQRFEALIADVHAGKGNTKKAISLMEDALAQDPYHFLAWYKLGLIYKAEGKRQKAKSCFQKVYAINDRFYNAHIELAELSLIERDYKSVEKYTAFYFEHHEGSKEKFYDESVWDADASPRYFEYWELICNQEDRVLDLLSRYERRKR